MAIENSVSIDFLSTFLDSIGVFDCRLPVVYTVQQTKALESLSLTSGELSCEVSQVLYTYGCIEMIFTDTISGRLKGCGWH